MMVEAHLAKWRRFDSVRRRFEPLDEFELWFWATASGATALINAALHATGVTEASRLFPTQVEHIYACVEDRTRWRRKIAAGGDLIVLDQPELAEEIPPELFVAFESMRVIEQFREPIVRGAAVADAKAVLACERAYRVVVAETQSTIGAWQA
jgi:hypothetical protein